MVKFIRELSRLQLSIVVLVLVIGFVALGLKYRADHSPKKIVQVGNPVSLPAAQKDSTPTPSEKTPVSNNSVSANAGGAIDNQGSNVPSTASNQWTTSASGNITVKSPAPNATLKDGDVIAGSAKVPQVSYRLSDNKVGVIAQGSLQVVNGNFSGSLHFSPKGTGGRLDIFSTDDQLVEYNEVEINVAF